MTDQDAPNQVIATILARRSVRFGYSERQVSESDLQLIVAAGLAAPSSKNARPWRLHVVTSREKLDAIASAAETADDVDTYVPPDPLTGDPSPVFQSTVRESAIALRDAPSAIALENRGVYIRDVEWLASRSPEVLARTLTAYGLETMGLGTALENMWLAANSLGIQAAFLGDLTIASPAARGILGLQGDLVGVLALGYSAAAPPPRLEPAPETQSESQVVWH